MKLRTLTLQDRHVAYARSTFGQKFPDSIPAVSPTGRYLYGHWTIGAQYKNASRLPGCYPPTILERLLALFPEVRPNRILHAFSGSIGKGRHTRLDVRAEPHAGICPEIVGSIYDLKALLAAAGLGPFFLVPCDPPYPGQAKKLYGTDGVDSARAFRAMYAALPAGAHVTWLSTHRPRYRSEQWIRWGSIFIEPGTEKAIRELSCYTRRAA